MGIRGYSKYDMIVADESQFSWGGTDYTLLALRSDTSIPSGLATSSYTGISWVDLSNPTTDATFTKSYIIPNLLDVLTTIDGGIEGTMKIGVTFNETPGGSAFVKITKVETTIKAIDANGSSRTIQEINDVWNGTLQRVGTSGSGTSTLQFMYWYNIIDAAVESNERIVIDFTITYSSSATTSPLGFEARIYSTVDTEETNITLPLVM